MTVSAALATTETKDVSAFTIVATFPSMIVVLVQFTAPHCSLFGCYNTGEIAGFPYWFAKELIAEGVGALYDAGDGVGYVL